VHQAARLSMRRMPSDVDSRDAMNTLPALMRVPAWRGRRALAHVHYWSTFNTWKYNESKGGPTMPRRVRVAASPFAQFMVSTGGRTTRGVMGIALIVAGLLIGGVARWMFGAFGLLLLAAGLFDFCVVTGLIDNIWSGREVRARGGHGRATRSAPSGSGVRIRTP
jgi:hypothetical protein